MLLKQKVSMKMIYLYYRHIFVLYLSLIVTETLHQIRGRKTLISPIEW